MINCSFFKVQRYNFIFIYKLFTSLFYHSHIISPQKPHLSLSNPLFSNILIFILSPPYLHLIFVHSSFILRSFFVHSSFILRPFFVHSSSILRSFFVHSSSILRPFFIDRATCSYPCDSHLPVRLTLFRHYLPPLLGRSLRIGEYVNGERILFLSPRNPVFNIFHVAVLRYESITYTPFLYQSSKIRISFL